MSIPQQNSAVAIPADSENNPMHMEGGLSSKIGTTESMEATGKRLYLTFLNDPELYKLYKTSQRKYFDLNSFVPLMVLLYTAAITRTNLQSIGPHSPFFSAAFALLIFTTLLFIPFLSTRMIVHYTPTDKQQQSSYKRSIVWLSLFYALKIEDVLGVLTEVIAGLHLLGRVYAGQCDSSTSVWSTQACNPVADRKSIPGDQVIFLYVIPLVAQCILRGISVQALIICCTLGVFFVAMASAHVGGLVEAWTLIYSIFFLVIMFTVERLMRVTFVHGQTMLAAVKLNNKHELELLELSTDNERQLKEKEIFQLRSLMGNVAHDLKTPLHSIEADLEVLRVFMLQIPRYALEKAKVEFLSNNYRDKSDPLTIFDSLAATCKFMGMAINRSQDFMKASHNIALIPVMETFELASTLAMSVTCMNHVQSARTIVAHPPDPDICPYLISDKHWLSENVLCLLSNAMKYSDDGVVDLRVKLTEVPTHGHGPSPPPTNRKATTAIAIKSPKGLSASSPYRIISHHVSKRHAAVMPYGSSQESKWMVLVTVEDRGIGITEEARKNLFQPFKQAQRMAGGTGLGLYSLSKRVEALGGSNGVSDRTDGRQGTMFWFTFPYRPDEVARLDVISDLTCGLDSSSPLSIEPPRHKSILVVDDSPSILKVTKRLLNMKGHMVETAANGFIGLKMLKEAFISQQYDMVLTDLQMPVMDGIEATRRYREFEEAENQNHLTDGDTGVQKKRRKTLLIVGMSANSDNQSKQEALDSGMDYFISKPFSYKDLKPILLSTQSRFFPTSLSNSREIGPVIGISQCRGT